MAARKLMLFALPFVLGTMLCQYLLPDTWQTFAAAAALLLGLALACLWKGGRLPCALAAFGLAAGMLWFWGCGQLLLIPAEELVGTEETVELEVLDYPEKRDYGARATVRILSRDLRGRAVCYGGEELLALEPGNRLTVTAKYYSAALVGGEESTYYTSRGVFLRLYSREDMEVSPGRAGSLRYLPQRMAGVLRSSIGEVFDAETAAFVTALLTGDREKLDQGVQADLQASGLMHITAVSGLHCTFLMGLLGLMLGRRRRLTLFVGYPALLVYMLMVGCTPSVVRSCIMVGFLLAAPLLGREGDSPTSLSAAALVILLVNPFAVASVSFQLSFAAVAGMLLVTPRLYGALGGGRRYKSRVLTALRSFLVTTVSASLGVLALTAPVSAFYFRYVPLVSPLTNLLVLWVAPALFACSLLAAVAAIPFPAAAVLAAAPRAMTRYVLWVADTLAGLPGNLLRFTTPTMALWLLLVYAMVLLCWLGRARRRAWGLAILLAALTLSAARAVPVLSMQGGELTVAAVDVGQGAATLFHSDGRTALVDCGSHYVSGGAGARVAEVMDTYGWDRLDCLVLTHYHEDHAGGVEQLLAHVEVGEILLPQLLGSADQEWLQREVEDLAARYEIPTVYVEEPVQMELGRAVLAVYPPLTRGETNEEGLTVLATSGNFDALITGDMNADTEQLLLERYALPDIELLLVGHHGSRYSTSQELLSALRPEIGIISVGENTYGHPTAEAMGRLARYGAQLYRTDKQGDVVIRVNEETE